MELHVLRRHGWSISALAREFGLSRRTVKRELEAKGARRYPRRRSTTELTAAQLAHVRRRLEICPSIRGTDLYAELRTEYSFAASYPTFQRLLRQLRPATLREPEIRFETGPGVQTQVDWAHLGLWPVGEHMVELYAMVAVLGCSRAVAIRVATDLTRVTSLERLVRCLDDLGGVTREVLTDRDAAFCIGSTSDGRAILAPDWVDLCALLGTVPKACRPYRAKTKGKVERVIREVKESFLAWLSGQPLAPRPSLADYDALARRWVEEVVLRRRHRTTKRVVGDAWIEEEPQLSAIPAHVLANFVGDRPGVAAPLVVDITPRLLGEHVEVRSLGEYEAAL
jgi:transposase